MKRTRLLLVGMAILVFGMAHAQVTFTYIEGQQIPTVDPAKAVDESSLHAVINTYDPLVRPESQKDSMMPGPSVAESWTVSPDGTTYTFKIQSGITFHDGSPLTAEDVVYSMQRMLAIKKGFYWLWAGVLDPSSVTAPDANTVVFKLSKPFSPFLATLTQLFIVNKHLLDANQQAGDFGANGDYGQKYLESHDAGSGPYELSQYNPAAGMTLTRFADYWRGWKPGQIDTVDYKVVLEEATIKTLLSSGQADMIDQWRTPQTYKELAKAKGVTVNEQPSAQLFHIEMDTQRAPLDNLDVRKAITSAMDYQTADNDILQGAAQAIGPVPIKAWEGYGVSKDELAKYGINPYKFDLEAAKQDLAQSGYKPGQIELTMVYPSGTPLERQVGLLLQSNLAKIGIKLNLKEEPWATIVADSAKAETDPDMAGIYDTLKYPHPDSHLYGMYTPEALGSYRTISRFTDPKVTQLLTEARATTDQQKQLDLYLQAEGIITQAHPSIYIANPMHRIAYRDYVKGYHYVGLLGYDIAFYDFTVQK